MGCDGWGVFEFYGSLAGIGFVIGFIIAEVIKLIAGK